MTQMNLDDLRSEIDRIDRKVLDLLNERVRLAAEIGKIKHSQGLAVYAPQREEEVFFPNNPQSILLPRHSQGFYLVQRIRDEAHRFAITAHRKQRNKIGMTSALDVIPGIGPAKRKSLLQHFGSLDKIRVASVDELSAVSGVNISLAETIKANLE